MRIAVSRLLTVLFLISCLAASSEARPQKKTRERRGDSAANDSSRDQKKAEPLAPSKSVFGLPFKRAWQHLTDSASRVAPTTDGSRVFLVLAGGRVICLNVQTGALIWSADPGGVITAPVEIAGEAAMIASRKIAAGGGDGGAALRAVERSTGLTLWARDYPRAFTSPLCVSDKTIYAGSADGSLYAISAQDGNVLWRSETQDVVRGKAHATATAIYFGSDDGYLRAVEPSNGILIWKLQTGGKVASCPISDDRFIYFGSGDGFAYAVNRTTGAIKWRSPTGAAIEASGVILNDRLLMVSFDNFVYCLSKSSGDRIWKRRLENRIAATPIVDGDANLVAPLQGNYVAMFLNADGRKVNLFQLEEDYEIVADPLFSGETLLLPTSKGLVAALPIRPAEVTTAEKK